MAAISGTGDLIATGTVSGATRESWGCLLELTRGGTDRLSFRTASRAAFCRMATKLLCRDIAAERDSRGLVAARCRGIVLEASNSRSSWSKKLAGLPGDLILDLPGFYPLLAGIERSPCWFWFFRRRLAVDGEVSRGPAARPRELGS